MPILGDLLFFSQPNSSLVLPSPSELKMLLKGESLPTPSLTLLNAKGEEKREHAHGSGHVLVSPALRSPSSANSTWILHWDTTSPTFKATRFVAMTPPSSREQIHLSGLARRGHFRTGHMTQESQFWDLVGTLGKVAFFFPAGVATLVV